MSRYCNADKQNEEIQNIVPMNLSEEIFKIKLKRFFEVNGLILDYINILPMNDDETDEYSKCFSI